MEENLNDYVNETLKRLKSNNDIWESLLVDKRDIEVNIREDRKKIVPFRERRVFERESFRNSFWYKFLQKDLTDINVRDGKNFNSTN